MSHRYTPDPRLIRAIEKDYGSVEDIVLQPHYTLRQHLMMPANNMLGVVYDFLKMSPTFMRLVNLGFIEMCDEWRAKHRGAARIPISRKGAEELIRVVYSRPVCLYVDVPEITIDDLCGFMKVIETYDFETPDFDVMQPLVV